MGTKSKDQLKGYFKRGCYPTQGQFGDLIDSMVHHGEGVAMSEVNGLSSALNGKFAQSEGERMWEQVRENETTITMLQEVNSLQDSEMTELRSTDEAQQMEIDEVSEQVGVLANVIRRGSSVADSLAALERMGDGYAGLYALATTVKTFLESVDTKDATINSWKEMEAFLAGITDRESLAGMLSELEVKITQNYRDSIAGALEEYTPLAMVEWADLVAMRDGGELQPGRMYRIVDYVTMVANDLEARSAGHPFDLIVVATGVDTISEEAIAVASERDKLGHFAGCRLDSWRVWYCLDNDLRRFQWANENGTGVIYRLIDEWGNDCPYDFKNIQFRRYCAGGKFVEDLQENVNCRPYFMADDMEEFDSIEFDGVESAWFYTFSFMDFEDGYVEDASLLNVNEINPEKWDNRLPSYGNNSFSCLGNVMEPYYMRVCSDFELLTVQGLNNIVLFTNDMDDFPRAKQVGNKWGRGCYNMTLYDRCCNNVFGVECYNMILACCVDNRFGVECYKNALGHRCDGNTFGNYCERNTLLTSSSENLLGDRCCGNWLEEDSSGNYINGDGNCLLRSYTNTIQQGGNNDLRYCGNCQLMASWCNEITSGGSNIDLYDSNWCKIGNAKSVTLRGVEYVEIGDNVFNAEILSGVKGSKKELLKIPFGTNDNSFQYAGLDTVGELQVWNPANIWTMLNESVNIKAE